MTFSQTTKYISLGNTTIFQGSDITLNAKQLEGDGFKIVTKGSNIIINGVTERSVYYGAIELLRQLVNYDIYAVGVEYFDKNVTDLALPDFDITDVGDIIYRICGTAPVRGDKKTRDKMRMYMDNECFLVVNGSGVHNSTVPEFHDWGYFPYNEYAESHPDFFSQDFKELCYTAHGNEKEYALMQEIALQRMKDAIIADPTKNILSFTQSDFTTSNCKCDYCQEAKEHYGSDSAAYLIFVNKVVKELNKWIEQENIRDIYVCSFAYNWSFDPPTIEPVPEELQLEENYTIFVAPIQADYFSPLNKGGNVGFGNTLEQWADYVNHVMVWLYSTHFTNLLTPFPNFDSMQETYSFLIDQGTMFVLEEGNAANAQPGFTTLKTWLQGKLMWNVNSDYNALLDDFFNKYFDLASAPMRQIFDEMRLWTKHQTSAIGLKGNCLSNNKLGEAATWPLGILEKWMDLTDQACKNIEIYKHSDPELYNELYKRIALEGLCFKYLIITNYSSYYQPSEILEMKKAVKNDSALVGFSYWGSGQISDLFRMWGI